MVKKLKLLNLNKERLIALFVISVMMFNACSNYFISGILPDKSNPDDFTPGGTIPGVPSPGDSNPINLNPMAIYVDTDGNYSETDSGRTVVIADEDLLDVFFYSDDASTYQRVGITFEDRNIIFVFEENHNFPISMVLSHSEESIYGFFTPYDPDTETYNLMFEQDDDAMIFSNIALSKEIFIQYLDSPELTQSQNLRIRNLYITLGIYLNLIEFINSNETPQPRFIGGIITWSARITNAILPSSPINTIMTGVFEVIGGSVAVVMGVKTIAAGIATAPTGIGVAFFIAAPIFIGLGIDTIAKGITNIMDGIFQITSGGGTSGEGSSSTAVTGVSLDRTSANITIGSKVTLIPTVTPANATNKTVSFNSSNTAVATVGINGVVTGNSVGSANITVTTADGNRIASCIVTVGSNVISVTGVSLDRSNVNINISNTVTLVPTVNPVNATNKTVSWSSSNVAVATVSNTGVVTGRSAGFATITVYTSDGNRTASCTVTVNPVIQTPVASDYTIGNLNQTAGSATAVIIAPNIGKSTGARTIYYQGINGTSYTRSTSIPQAAGTYTVTFDVAAASGWNSVTGLTAGTLVINQRPVAGDYTIGNLNQTAGIVTAVTITANSGKSPGTVSNIYYNGNTTVPQTGGIYQVTFDVTAASGWSAATGLFAGTLTVSNQTPVADDYDIVISQTGVSISPKAGKSTGIITIFYDGSTTLPSSIGIYTVTFNVAAANYWNATNGLNAGTWTISQNIITLNIEQIIDHAPIFNDITISRTNPASRIYDVSVNASDFDTGSIRWEVAGVGIYSGQTVTGSGLTFKLDATDIRYNSLGGHFLILTVSKDGMQYRRAIPFTIVQ